MFSFVAIFIQEELRKKRAEEDAVREEKYKALMTDLQRQAHMAKTLDKERASFDRAKQREKKKK